MNLNLENKINVNQLKYSQSKNNISQKIKERMVQDERGYQIDKYQENKKEIKKENYKIPLVGGKYFNKLYLPKKK